MLSGINPFKRKDKTKFEKLQMITNVEIPYFKVFSPEAKSLLKSLLVKDVSNFLGNLRISGWKCCIFSQQKLTEFLLFCSQDSDWVSDRTESTSSSSIHFSQTSIGNWLRIASTPTC
jgi:hypothetical protein